MDVILDMHRANGLNDEHSFSWNVYCWGLVFNEEYLEARRNAREGGTLSATRYHSPFMSKTISITK